MASTFTKVFNKLFGDPVASAYKAGFSGSYEDFTDAMRNKSEKVRESAIDGVFDAYAQMSNSALHLQRLFSDEFGLFNIQDMDKKDSQKNKVMRSTFDLMDQLITAGTLDSYKLYCMFIGTDPKKKEVFLASALDRALERKDINAAIILAKAGASPMEERASHTLYAAEQAGNFTNDSLDVLFKHIPTEGKLAHLNAACALAESEDNKPAVTALLEKISVYSEKNLREQKEKQRQEQMQALLDSALVSRVGMKQDALYYRDVRSMLEEGADPNADHGAPLTRAAITFQEDMVFLLYKHGARFDIAIESAKANNRAEAIETLKIYQERYAGKKDQPENKTAISPKL